MALPYTGYNSRLCGITERFQNSEKLLGNTLPDPGMELSPRPVGTFATINEAAVLKDDVSHISYFTC